MYSYLVMFFILYSNISLIQSRKNCKLLRRGLNAYYLSCDNTPIISERTVIRHENKKEKKERKSRRGPPGLQGPQGLKGQKGDRGFDGREGPMGPIGPTGVPGPRGTTGPKGDKGDMGYIGSIGPQGPPGVPGNCIKDTSAVWKNNDKMYHCLPGPQGPQGEHGKEGPKGIKGSIGKQGIKGDKGDTGPRGRRGPVGLPGMPGSSSSFECNDYNTEWYSRYVQNEGLQFKGLYCPKQSYLQGFEIERTDSKERFKYRCCKIG